MGGRVTAERHDYWSERVRLRSKGEEKAHSQEADADADTDQEEFGDEGQEADADADADQEEFDDERQEKLVDCKVIARALAKKDPMSISPRRGYVIVPGQGFVEHWWAVKGASEEIIDLTDMPYMFGVTPTYVPLDKENAPILLSTCDAVSGPCQDKPACAWCRTRLQIEAKGEAPLYDDTGAIKGMRLVLDHLTARNRVLRAALVSTVVRDGVCLLCHVKVVGGVHGPQCVLKAEG